MSLTSFASMMFVSFGAGTVGTPPRATVQGVHLRRYRACAGNGSRFSRRRLGDAVRVQKNDGLVGNKNVMKASELLLPSPSQRAMAVATRLGSSVLHAE